MMNKYANLPPEMRAQIAAPFLTMFGGQDKLDCWLTKTADQLADPGNPAIRPISLDQARFPAEFQSWMHRPGEVVDHILEQLESLAIFGYTAKIVKQGEIPLAIITDQASSHIIEEAAGPDPESLIRSLGEKYGPNLEVVKE